MENPRKNTMAPRIVKTLNPMKPERSPHKANKINGFIWIDLLAKIFFIKWFDADKFFRSCVAISKEKANKFLSQFNQILCHLERNVKSIFSFWDWSDPSQNELPGFHRNLVGSKQILQGLNVLCKCIDHVEENRKNWSGMQQKSGSKFRLTSR